MKWNDEISLKLKTVHICDNCLQKHISNFTFLNLIWLSNCETFLSGLLFIKSLKKGKLTCMCEQIIKGHKTYTISSQNIWYG